MLLCGTACSQSAFSAEIDSALPDAKALFLDLHQHPELSGHETRSAALLASKLRALGYEVTEHVGGTGIVALMRNDPGATVMLRTELDALPVEEKTGLPYASKAHAKNDAGIDVPVMHACGHDLHMSSLYATAAIMAHTRQQWHGTLMLRQKLRLAAQNACQKSAIPKQLMLSTTTPVSQRACVRCSSPLWETTT